MILGIDSTTERLHLALVGQDQAWTRLVPVGPGFNHSNALLPTVDALMVEAGASPGQLRGVVACVGPGGFTALRIGVATAEGLALTGLPTWGFSAFELRAQALRVAGVLRPHWILLDGQRQEAFVQKWSGEGALSEGAKHPVADLPNLLAGAPWWAPQPFRTRLEALLGACPLDFPEEDRTTLEGLVALCRQRVLEVPESPLVPFYLRETDAEVNFPAASVHLSAALRQGVPR